MNNTSAKRAPNTRVKLKDIYRTYMGKRGGQPVWVVDWHNVCSIYPDWIMGGNDQRYRFNPNDEVWIDSSMGIEEYEYTVQHELIEQQLMRDKLWTYDQAHDFSNHSLDAALRKKNGDRVESKLKKLRKNGAPAGFEAEQYEHVYLASNGRVLGHEVWVVNGSLIRRRLDCDFAFPGAHSMRRKYVPSGEIWLDNAMSCGQLKFSMVELVSMLKAKRDGKTLDEAYAAGFLAREKERERQRKLCLAHELALPPVRIGARNRGVRNPVNH